MSIQILQRAALGSAASLGDLYDARQDRFLPAANLFHRTIPEQAIEAIDSTFSDIQYIHTDSYSEKFSKLNVIASLQVSILCGLVTMSGSGRYIDDKKQSARSVRSSLLYSIRTKNEKLNVAHEDLKSAFSHSVLKIFPESTHYVSEIEWGANTMLLCEYENTENIDTTEIGGELYAAVEYAGVKIQGNASITYANNYEGERKSFKFRVFGDIIPKGQVPNTVEAAVDVIRQVPQLLREINAGKGSAISYTLSPISDLKKYLEFDKGSDDLIQSVDLSILKRVVKCYEAMHKSEQLVFDLYSDMEKYSSCVSPSQRRTVEMYQVNLKKNQAQLEAELKKAMVDVRSGQIGIESVSSILQDFYTSDISPRSVSRKLKEWSRLTKKVKFARKMKQNGVTYIGYGGSFVKHLLDSHGKKQIFLYIKPNAESVDELRWRENLQLFLSEVKAKASNKMLYIVDCEFDATLYPKNKHLSTIAVFVNGQLREKDLVEEQRKLQGKALVSWKNTPKRLVTFPNTTELIPFVSICPGRTCKPAKKYEWMCKTCGKQLNFGIDNYIYCDCGRSLANSTRFMCSDPKHGLEFFQHTYSFLTELMTKLRPVEKCNETTHFQEERCVRRSGPEGECQWDQHCEPSLVCVQGICLNKFVRAPGMEETTTPTNNTVAETTNN